MNRKQEIAAWVFGIIAAVGLLLADKGFWALLVLSGLTILSLRDRQSKNRATNPSDPQPGPQVADEVNGLRSMTPHLLATAILQRRAEGLAPFKAWRDIDVEVPPGKDEIVAIACEFYQLRVFLDLLQQRFGLGITKLVEASFASIIDDVRGLAMFSKVNAAVSRARVLGPSDSGPDNQELRLDLQVADQYLSIFAREEQLAIAQLRLPLARCLTQARISAGFAFSGLVAQIDFDPVSVAAVSRETAYRGNTNRWKERPGCFERHLQRKEGNHLFPEGEQHPTDGAIHQARARDESDMGALKQDIAAVLRRASERFTAQVTIPTGTIVDFLRIELDPLVRRAAEIGQLASAEFEALEELRNTLLERLEASSTNTRTVIEDLKQALQGQFNLFLAQSWRDDTPITTDEIVPALVCESTATVKGAVEALQRTDAAMAQELCETAARLLRDCKRTGFPGADEKLAVLRSHFGGASAASQG